MSHSALAAGVRHLRRAIAAQHHRDESDEQLLHAFIDRRDDSAFAVLVHRHGPMVMGVCRRVLGHQQDAEDAFQATFLVLARNAAGLHKKTALVGFLHGTAYRTALAAKRAAARRRKHERQAPVRQADDPAGELLWREVRALLDAEVARLPEIYRSVFVLCSLEGVSQAEAARRLELKEATVSSRLAAARKRLQTRLSRRGVELTALLAAATLTTESAPALPAALLTKTIEDAVSPAVAALANSGPSIFGISKAKLAMLLLTASLLGGSGVLVHFRQAAGNGAPPAAEKAKPQPPARPATKKDQETATFAGRVLDPDGKPLAGARVFLLPNGNPKKADAPARASTDKDGRFLFTARSADLGPQGKGVLAATAKGFGLDWIDLNAKDKNEEITLRLVADDKPIEGRVLNLEGKPIAGVTVQVRSVRKQTDGSDLASWVERNVKAKHVPDSELDKLKLLLPAGLDVPTTATSGEDGRFRLIGFGRERVLRLALRGPNTADADFFVVTRTGPAKGWISGQSGLYGSHFDYVMGPCKPVVGVVRDKRTGKPLAGITVAAADGRRWCEAKTDNQGRYRIVGLAKSKEYDVGAGGMPYINCPKNHIADTLGLDPLNVDFELDRGIAVKGRLIDKTTGKPVRGHVYYQALPDNPHLKDFPDQNKGGISPYNPGVTSADGSFTVVAIPGLGWLGAQANAVNRFAHMEGADDVYHAQTRIDLSEDDPKSTFYEIALEPAGILKGSVLGPDNRPLAGAYTAGCSPIIYPALFSHEKLDSNTFTVGGVKPGRPRVLTFYHREKKLGKVLLLQGDETKPLAVRLEPLGAIAGRILDAKGRPWVGLKVLVSLTGVDKTYPPEFHWGGSSWLELTRFETTTDREGKFRIDGLLPGLKYGLYAYEGELVIQPEVALPYRANDLTVEPGKTKDLGDLKSKQTPDK